ncbi:MAG: hypothetical protein JSW61_01330 [Candidatus Thorarchaeota archaeon]|nr:MAG: hypothetical protein JSW61_01330 [Candidatus Thorarchaeota archaeon]
MSSKAEEVKGRVLGSSLAIVIVLCTVSVPVEACTGITASYGERVLVGLNEDWPSHNNFNVRFVPPREDRFGYVVFCATELPYDDLRAGMNTEGLIVDTFLIPLTPMNETDKQVFPRNVMAMILEDCSDSGDVVSLFEQYTLWSTHSTGVWDIQFFVVDKDGDSVIISPGSDGRIAFTSKEGIYQVVTNFNPVMPELGWYPCERYNLGVGRLHRIESPENITVDSFRRILQWTGRERLTAYSVIFDPEVGDMWVFYNYDFEKCAELNLLDELEDGAHSEKTSMLNMEAFVASETQFTSSTFTISTDSGNEVAMVIVGGAIGVGIGFVVLFVAKRKIR